MACVYAPVRCKRHLGRGSREHAGKYRTVIPQAFIDDVDHLAVIGKANPVLTFQFPD